MKVKMKMLQTVTLGTLLTLAAGSAAAQPARHGAEIRKAVVSGYTLTYNLIDMAAMMQSTQMPMTHGSDGSMKSHHLMVYLLGPDGKPATNGKVGYLVNQPDKTDFKTLTMPMEGGFGADIDLVATGDYKITTKIVLGATTLMDEFVYTAKKAVASDKIAVGNTKCPITGGALGSNGVVKRLTRDYKGLKIGFCCDGCPQEWDRMSDADKDAKLSKAK